MCTPLRCLRWSNVAVSVVVVVVVVCDPGEADPLRPYQDCSGSGALLVCGDSDQQELCCTAGRARHLRARGRRRRRLTQGRGVWGPLLVRYHLFQMWTSSARFGCMSMGAELESVVAL